jgi:hypothetical protein
MYIADATSIGHVFFTGTVNIILIALSVFSIAFVVWTHRRERALKRARASAEGPSAAPAGTTE